MKHHLTQEFVDKVASISPPMLLTMAAQVAIDADVASFKPILEVLDKPDISEHLLGKMNGLKFSFNENIDYLQRSDDQIGSVNASRILPFIPMVLRTDLEPHERPELNKPNQKIHMVPIFSPPLDDEGLSFMKRAIEKVASSGNQNAMIVLATKSAGMINDRRLAHMFLEALEDNRLLDYRGLNEIMKAATCSGNANFLRGMVDRMDIDALKNMMGFAFSDKFKGFASNISSKDAEFPMLYLKAYASIGPEVLEQIIDRIGQSEPEMTQEDYLRCVRWLRFSLAEAAISDKLNFSHNTPLNAIPPVDGQGKSLVAHLLDPVREDGSPAIGGLRETLQFMDAIYRPERIMDGRTARMVYVEEDAPAAETFFSKAGDTQWHAIFTSHIRSFIEDAIERKCHEIIEVAPSITAHMCAQGVISNPFSDKLVTNKLDADGFSSAGSRLISGGVTTDEMARRGDPYAIYNQRLLATIRAMEAAFKMPMKPGSISFKAENIDDVLIEYSKSDKPNFTIMADLVRAGADPEAKDSRGWKASSYLKGDHREHWNNFVRTYKAKDRIQSLLSSRLTAKPQP